MLFHRDDFVALAGSAQNDLFVQRLDGGHVDHAHTDGILTLQGDSSLQSFAGHQTGGDDGQIKTVAQNLALADFKSIVIGIMQGRGGQTAETQVNGALVGVSGAHSGTGFQIVRGADHDHAGDGAHQRKVLAALVGSTVLADGQAAVGGSNLDVQLGVTDAVADLLKSAARSKHGKRGNKRHIAKGGHAGGYTDHVALGNAAVKKAFRIFFCKY